MRVYGKDYARRAAHAGVEFALLSVGVIATMHNVAAAAIVFFYTFARSMGQLLTSRRLERDIVYVDITVVSHGHLGARDIDRSIN